MLIPTIMMLLNEGQEFRRINCESAQKYRLLKVSGLEELQVCEGHGDYVVAYSHYPYVNVTNWEVHLTRDGSTVVFIDKDHPVL